MLVFHPQTPGCIILPRGATVQGTVPISDRIAPGFDHILHIRRLAELGAQIVRHC